MLTKKGKRQTENGHWAPTTNSCLSNPCFLTILLSCKIVIVNQCSVICCFTPVHVSYTFEQSAVDMQDRVGWKLHPVTFKIPNYTYLAKLDTKPQKLLNLANHDWNQIRADVTWQTNLTNKKGACSSGQNSQTADVHWTFSMTVWFQCQHKFPSRVFYQTHQNCLKQFRQRWNVGLLTHLMVTNG